MDAKVGYLAICRGWASPEGTSNATPFWSRGHASVGGACCWGPPDELGCLLSYRQLMSGCRRVRYPLTTDSGMHSLYLTTSARYYPERIGVRGAPWKSLGVIRRATYKGESGFGKASDRVKAKDHHPSEILGEVWWGALSKEGKRLDRCSKVIIGFQSLSQAL